MPFFYAIKHMVRSWRLFLALLVGITLASTFFAGIDIKTNATARQAYETQLSSVYVDMKVNLGTLYTPQVTAPIIRGWILNVEGVREVEIISRASGLTVIMFDENRSVEYDTTVVALTNNSHVYAGWSNRPVSGLGENETYIAEDSPLAKKVGIGDVVQVVFSVQTARIGWTSISLNLTVKGFAKLDDEALTIASGGSQMVESNLVIDLLIVSWEKTLPGIFEEAQRLGSSSDPAETSLLIYLNREALIAPWDIDSSINNIYKVERQIDTTIAGSVSYPSYGSRIVNYLEYPLNSLRSAISNMRFMFITISLTVFFLAWYVGTTVSAVSYSLRRREIGLLSTKGFSRGQILRIFLIETALIGLLGGVFGLMSAFILVPLFTQFSAVDLFNPHLVNPFTVIFTVVFGIVMALLSTFSSARKASQLVAVDALREYLPTEEAKQYKKKWPWIAFSLGTYKMVVFGLGINMFQALTGVMFSSGNIVILILLAIFAFLDLGLNYIGPLLFFWGFTKLFIHLSLKFQQLTSRVGSLVSDMSALAAKNVRRNPARSAAMAFLIALIISYSVQATAQLASEQDYAKRQTYFQIGADLTIGVVSSAKAPEVQTMVMVNLSDQIKNTTIEYLLQGSDSKGASVPVRAVEPSSWLETAFYEDSWFSGTDITTVFNNLTKDRRTIILDKSLAQLHSLDVGDTITLVFGSTTETFSVVGFFGPGLSIESQQAGIVYGSLVSSVLYQELSDQIPSTARILVRLRGGADGAAVAASIRSLEVSGIESVNSFAEDWADSQTDVIKMASLDVQRLSVVFAILAASVGTALVSSVSMKERSREAAIMSVKGLSYRQLIVMFLIENLALIVFSVTLGVIAGLTVTYGNISALDTLMLSPVRHRLVFSPDAIMALVFSTALIVVSTILPVLIMLRRYVTRLERMVRLR